MTEQINSSVQVFETALTAQNPVEALLKLATEFLEKGEVDKLYDIDIMLVDRFIEFIRYGVKDNLDAFLYSILSFLDGSGGEKLENTEDGKRYFFRWEHFHDLCKVAIENYDPQFTSRFIDSRKHGPQLMQILHESEQGVRFKDLAEQLHISRQQLAKLLREFEAEDLIARKKEGNYTVVSLGFLGRIYVSEQLELSAESSEQAGFSAESSGPLESKEPGLEESRLEWSRPEEPEMNELEASMLDRIGGLAADGGPPKLYLMNPPIKKAA
jgi:CRP-like cAMP-binding protein